MLIITFIIYYIIFIIHIFQHIHYYKSSFYKYQLKLVKFFLNHSYTTITVLEVISHLNKTVFKTALKSHATRLANLESFPELLQHSGTALKNPTYYNHVSAPYWGYDAMFFHPNDLREIESGENTDLVTLRELKMMKKGNIGQIFSYHKKYSKSNIDCINNYGIRPAPADHLEIGFYTSEAEETVLTNKDLAILNKPIIITKNYSDAFVKVEFHPKHGGLGSGTIISDSAFEELKWFYDHLKKNEELFLYVNNLLENDPTFPF